MNFQFSRIPILIILAPHLTYPPRNGADIYIERLGCHLSAFRDKVYILGANTLTRYETGKQVSQYPFKNNMRTKTSAAIRTLLLKSHYLVEKFLTNEFRRMAKELVQENPQAIIIYSFISSSSLELTNDAAVIVTHNDEITFYRKQRATIKKPLQKLVALFSEKWLVNFLGHSKNNHIYVHITDDDQIAYSNYILHQKSVVVPAGVEDCSLVVYAPPVDNTIHLLFCGSLSVKMNVDALLHFKDNFWGLLKECFLKDIDVWIAGSNPTSFVINLCKDQGWILFPNISDEVLNSLYSMATFGILPYKYSDGAKIKLLNYMAAGLPVMATNSVKTIKEQDFPPNLYSNDHQKWLEHLQNYRNTENDILSGRNACRQFAMQYNWKKIAEKLHRDLLSIGC